MKVFFVEDNKDIREGVKNALEKENLLVDTAEAGDVALNRLLSYYNAYDVVVLDMLLPKVHGKEICRVIRKNGISIPIIMLTGTRDLEEKVEALDAGADDYITKPFFIKELLARVRALLRRPRQVADDRLLICSGLMLNPRTRKVYKNNQEIALTLKEYAILELLMKNPGQVLARDKFLVSGWDFNFYSFANVVDVHINNIRRKLGMGKKGALETVHGVGYRLRSS
jgi:DNA-binding response OmpR family regulator